MERKFDCDDIQIGKNVKIADDVIISGGKFIIGDYTNIKSGTKIYVTENFEIGKRSIIGENNLINGRNIKLGREFYSNHSSEIGGGSCYEKTSILNIGYWFHIGSYSIINTAMEVKIGSEVGMGRFSNIYSHGAYQSSINGFPVSFAPVTIGDRVWLPNATVNPGVTIGSDVVVGASSLVTKDIPSGALAIGSPCKIIKENYYPQKLSPEKRESIIENIFQMGDIQYETNSELIFDCYGVMFNFNEMKIEGTISNESERARNLLRRNGIRFKVEIDNECYELWE